MIDLTRAVVYDVESFPNMFSLHAEELNGDASATWRIDPWRNDLQSLLQWFEMLRVTGTPMIGFNVIGYDYNVIHEIFKMKATTADQIYRVSQGIINQQHGGFRKTVFESERFAPQIDLFKIHHFDNRAKSTSLKALEINMRSKLVLESRLPFDAPLTQEQIEREVIPYNIHDVKETKKFAQFSMSAINFRLGLLGQVDGDLMNFSDTKIGGKLLEKRLGQDVCYSFDSNGKRQPRQTYRSRIALKDIIFPYIRFNHPEFQRVHHWMMQQVLTPEDLEDPDASIKTKGVFNGVKANVGGIDFYFGTGGIHGSVSSQVFIANDEWIIEDIDVAALYPNIAIQNNLAPEHLGSAFTAEYAKLPEERKQWQKKKGKKCVEANSLKLAGNGTYGNSNNKFSVFYDPQFTMTITINGQLMLCMLAEWLLAVPTLQIIQINTDGITYRMHKRYRDQAVAIWRYWEDYTKLTLEDVQYSRMWIRDVNSYIAEGKDGSLKLKGAYWSPDHGDNYAKSISECQPPAWHKDLGNCVSIKAAVAQMVHGIPIEMFIRMHSDPFDFMCRVKVDRSSKLMLGDVETQRVTRYYVSTNGQPLVKISPPTKGNQIGEFRRKNGLSDAEYRSIAQTIAPGVWDERIHTKNKSTYKMRETAIEAGWKISECNDADHFSFANLDYRWYEQEAQKLIVR